MEPEYVMIESVRDAQPDYEDGTTISSLGMESLDAAADAASTALRHAEAEGARGLAVFGQPVVVAELDAQEKIRELERHLEALKLQIAEREDADMGVDLLGLESQADDDACQPPLLLLPLAQRRRGWLLLLWWPRRRALLHDQRQRPSLLC